MLTRLVGVAAAGALLAGVSACEPADAPSGPCPGLAGCFDACTGTDCPPGLYCTLQGYCSAQCTPERTASDCGPAERCTERGRCALDVPDAGPEDPCATASVDVRPIVPTVLFVVDRSGSMRTPFGDGDGDERRWDALYEALFHEPQEPGDAVGVVRKEEHRVRFGVAMYTQAGGSCPDLRWRTPALFASPFLSRDFIDYPPGGTGTTPTAEAVRAASARVLEGAREGERIVLVLATDGEPDRCDAPGDYGEVSRAAVVDAVADAHAAGLDTFLISLAELDTTHLQDVANAGVGLPVLGAYDEGDARAELWSPLEIDGLRQALLDIVGGALSCVVELDGELASQSRACAEGVVRFDGRLLECAREEDGYRVLDATHIELLGRACRDFLTGAGTTLEAEFPCVDVPR